MIRSTMQRFNPYPIEDGQSILLAYGFKPVSSELNEKFWIRGDTSDEYNVFDERFFIVATHPSMGSFTEQLKKNVHRISELANGRLCRFLIDPTGWWHNVLFLIGEDQELLDVLR